METFDYLKAYLNQGLSNDQQKSFEQKLKLDAAFAKEVKEEALLLNAFDEIKALELKLRLENIEKSLKKESIIQSRFNPLLKWAATIAFVMLTTAWYLWSHQQSKDALFVAFYTPYPNVESPLVRSDANQDDAWQLYGNGEFEAAYKVFLQKLNKDQSNEAMLFYSGICAIELNKFSEAEESFKVVLNFTESKYAKQAQWYLALSYLKEGEMDKTIIELTKIVASQSSYAAKAEALLLELE